MEINSSANVSMADVLAAYDWARSPLGPQGYWPEALKIAVQIVMNSRFPMFIWWGPQLISIYNDGYVPMLGKKHPASFARPASEVWREIWDVVGPQTDLVIQHHRSTWNEEMLLVMERHDYVEETYFTFAYSPIGAASGNASGLFCAVTEETSKVIGRRRLKTLRELAMETADLRTPSEVFAAAAAVIDRNPHDIPFALLYELDRDGRNAVLAGVAGAGKSNIGAPARVGLSPEMNPWGLKLDSGECQLIGNLENCFAEVPAGPWPEGPREALLLPFAKQAGEQPAGFMIAGLNRYAQLHDDYRGFLTLAAGQIAIAVANSRAFEAERKRTESLTELDRAKTAFFSNVSHEFRTPLTLMLGPLEDALANTHGILPMGAARDLEIAHRNALRLKKLVNTLLDFARIEAGRMQSVYEETDLAALTREIASVFRSAMERAGLTYVVDAPKLREPVYVDREMWEKIVLNLLSNAFKFTLHGEVRLTLEIDGAFARLVVSDTGSGIPEHELPRLFERFHRVTGARGRSFEGSGIGLALIQELAKLHGGRVTAENRASGGSQFSVYIPLGSAHLPADRVGVSRAPQPGKAHVEAFVEEASHMLAVNEDEPAVATETSHTGKELPRLLIADDNSDMRGYLQRLFSKDYEVEVAADGIAALEAAKRSLPALLLSDVMMPRLDGFGLLRAMRADKRTATVPVILLTARAGEDERIEGLGMGAHEYVTKPFSGRELLARVKATIALSRAKGA